MTAEVLGRTESPPSDTYPITVRQVTCRAEASTTDKAHTRSNKEVPTSLQSTLCSVYCSESVFNKRCLLVAVHSGVGRLKSD